MMNIVEEITAAAAAIAAMDTGKYDGLYNALEQRIGGLGAKDTAEAIELIKSTGEPPDKYLATTREWQRQQQLAQRMAIAQAEAEQRMRHAEELHQLELRRLTSEIERHEAATSTVKAAAAASV